MKKSFLNKCSKKLRGLWVVVVIGALVGGSLLAVPPRDPNYRGPFPKDHVHKIPDVRTLRALGYSPNQIQKVIGTTGTKKVAVVLVNFPSADSTTSGSPVMTSTDIVGFNTLFANLKSFYNECSYGQLNLDITFFHSTGSTTNLTGGETPYMLGNPMQYYGQDSEASLSQLVKDAILSAAVNSSSYDCVMVAHAGYGDEGDGLAYPGDIWSVFVTWSGAVNGFTEGTIVPAREASGSSALGVICHEFGHQLGLWDLYDSSVQSSKVGIWSLMDYGCWGGNGFKPSHPCAWDKEKLGWINPVVVSSATTRIFYPVETSSNTIVKIPIDIVADGSQYFLLEYRKKSAAGTNWDGDLPGDGILIWYIDEGTIDGIDFASRQANNTLNLGTYSHLTVTLKNADTTDPGSNHGDSTDPWPGTRTNFTSPYSDTWDGKPTLIAVTSFQGAGSSQMSANITKIAAAPTLSVVRGINYPNPANDQTTIQFVLTRPPEKYRLDLYNLAGELVAENLPMSVSARSRDNYWIYESNFNTRNLSGDLLSPGVYIYLLTADGQKKSGKLVIER